MSTKSASIQWSPWINKSSPRIIEIILYKIDVNWRVVSNAFLFSLFDAWSLRSTQWCAFHKFLWWPKWRQYFIYRSCQWKYVHIWNTWLWPSTLRIDSFAPFARAHADWCWNESETSKIEWRVIDRFVCVLVRNLHHRTICRILKRFWTFMMMKLICISIITIVMIVGVYEMTTDGLLQRPLHVPSK